MKNIKKYAMNFLKANKRQNIKNELIRMDGG